MAAYSLVQKIDGKRRNKAKHNKYYDSIGDA